MDRARRVRAQVPRCACGALGGESPPLRVLTGLVSARGVGGMVICSLLHSCSFQLFWGGWWQSDGKLGSTASTVQPGVSSFPGSWKPCVGGRVPKPVPHPREEVNSPDLTVRL